MDFAQRTIDIARENVLAIREACMKLGTEHLTGTTIYVLAHPCRCVWARCTTAHLTGECKERPEPSPSER